MIIAFSGYAGAGKSTAAQVLVDKHNFTLLSFAQPLKQALLTLDPLIHTYWDEEDGLGHTYLSDIVQDIDRDEEWRYAKEFPEVRRLLQRLGTEVGRELWSNDFWVSRLKEQIEPGKNYVISDMRFPNEHKLITDLDGITVRIESGNIKAVNGHPSESALDNTTHDITVTNNGTIEDFKDVIGVLCGSLDLTPAL